ncbi:hypothetical protein [Thiohalomonas denitrificans]|uniref:Sulfur reduction protein DsrS n=1 Tax=Thiohalomonas denitrificans TaxID=415747 RepID=A0A1G5PKB9_9GAMM|nr:hypothetical protein [Thiohalomonas denitrificans]SCZ49898.1 hypothetical protein SAMN03097708_00289 [Thiohalomonas denitrificans]
MKSSRRQNVELSSEDALRLNVLIANAEAVRIDEGAMTVYGLNGEQEMKVPLNPTCRSDKYLTCVRETLAAVVLDSPGGYPVFLRRWTRMGQVDNEQLDRLLKIGEPEAVMAVVCSPGLDNELARRAWWVAPYSEHARRMLERPQIVRSEMGRILAEHLVEHLPFETEHRDILDTVRLVLQPDLLSEERRLRLWEAGRSRKTYRVGFLEAVPDDLPEPMQARHDLAAAQTALGPLAEAGNPYAVLLLKLLDSSGQTFLAVALDALRRPADQEVVGALLNAIGRYLAAARRNPEQLREIETVQEQAESMLSEPDEELAAVLAAVPELQTELRAMLELAHIDEGVVIPVFALSDAIGTVMRKKIEPVTTPVNRAVSILRATG